MKELFFHYWYVGAIFSAFSTIGGMVWTVQAERRLRALRRETARIWKSVGGISGKLYDVENYLERTPTAYFRKAPRLTILPVPPVNDPTKKEA